MHMGITISGIVSPHVSLHASLMMVIIIIIVLEWTKRLPPRVSVCCVDLPIGTMRKPCFNAN
jgi:predicted alpha/beta hydrolase